MCFYVNSITYQNITLRAFGGLEPMTRLELVNAIQDPIKKKPMSPLNKSYKEKCLKFLSDKYNMEPELLDVRFKGHNSASKFVSSVIQKYRQSNSKFDRMTKKFRCGLSLQQNDFKLYNIFMLSPE